MRVVVLVIMAMSLGGVAGCNRHRMRDFTVAAPERDAVVADILRELDTKYVFPERAARSRPELVRRWSTDEFRRTTSGLMLAERMSEDLRNVYGDKHLFVLPARAVPPSSLGPDHPLSPTELAEEREQSAKTNYGVRRVAVLDGNIGYLDLVEFPVVQLAEVADVVRRSMDAVAGTTALIIDLRDNHGGDGDTVALWMSYLLDERTLLLESYDRTTGKTTPDWTSANVAGRRYGAARPVTVLTSHKTFSAGEELAYDVQTLGRGTVVGEATGGGANHNMFVPVGGKFVLSVAYAWVKSPITNANWEGTGVKPDVEVPAARALETAIARANATTAAKTAPARRAE